MTTTIPRPARRLAIEGGVPIRAEPIEAIVPVGDETRRRVMELLDSGRLSDYYNGPWTRRFEEAFASYHDPELRAVAVNSGTSALHLALAAAGIGPGDEVIVPALCFVAAATAVVQTGAVPILCDAEPEYLTLDLKYAESLIGPRTQAILPVHFWGYPTDVVGLRALCDRHNLLLIEDCAQALGAPAGKRTVGQYADYATYAFSVRKHIACGEGGMVMCRDEERYRRLRSLSNYGKGPGWDDYWSPGYSYRMPELSAVIALEGLEHLDEEIAARRKAGTYYVEVFGETDLTVVPEPPWGQSVYFKCPILVPEAALDVRRDLVEAVKAENISCRVPHRPLFSIPWLRELLESQGRRCEELPVASSYHARLFEIETGPHLPMEEVRRNGDAVLEIWRQMSAGSRR